MRKKNIHLHLNKDKEHVVKLLGTLTPQEFLEVLQAAFEKRKGMDNNGFPFTHYFLGQASVVDNETDYGSGPERQREYSIAAVGDYDRDHYPSIASGEISWGDQGFWQDGECPECKTTVASVAMNAVCPICGAKIVLT